MNFFERRKILKQSNAFDLTPIRRLNHELDDNSIVTLLLPRFKNKYALMFISDRVKNNPIKIKLDEIGSAVWLAIDNQKKIGVIAKELLEKFGERITPIEERLPKFFTQLYDQRYITFKELEGD